MFYADDAIFVGQWCDNNINILTLVLDCFYRASGLKINMTKSKIMGIHVADYKVNGAAAKLGCLMLNTPFSYLGTKVGGFMSRTHAWEEVIDKAIHGEDRKIGKDLKACNKSCWLNIVNEITVLKLQGFKFFDFMRIKLGNGINISFWNDNWIGGNTLKKLYPRIYALENYKHVTVHMKLADQTLAASLRRKPRGGSGDFLVSSIRTEIDNKRPKANVHAWKVKLDALPTRLNISRREAREAKKFKIITPSSSVVSNDDDEGLNYSSSDNKLKKKKKMKKAAAAASDRKRKNKQPDDNMDVAKSVKKVKKAASNKKRKVTKQPEAETIEAVVSTISEDARESKSSDAKRDKKTSKSKKKKRDKESRKKDGGRENVSHSDDADQKSGTLKSTSQIDNAATLFDDEDEVYEISLDVLGSRDKALLEPIKDSLYIHIGT
nr:RNA-directed DNA polymerase, eukaryota, reverse transcriptase zinc-binding domain protein [Tanacetum cinerariifolium]